MQNISIEHTRDYIIDNFLFGEAGGFDNETSFMEAGILDSTGILELITFLEKTYDIKVHDDEIIPENMDSLSNLAVYIADKKSRALES